MLDIYASLMSQGQSPVPPSSRALCVTTHLSAPPLVTRLNEVRATPKASNTGTDGNGATTASGADGDDDADAGAVSREPAVEHEENRVDTILNDVFQLLSLFFLRIGKSREAPATFCQLGTMKRLLTHRELHSLFRDLIPPLTTED